MSIATDSPAPEQVAPVAVRGGRGPSTNLVSLILAALLLVASIAAGAWLIGSSPVPPVSPTAERLVSGAGHESYGGDAYTGIQNAAADTENAVVAGANTAASLASELQATQLEADAAWWGHLWKGLAALIVAIGAANFVVVLQRFGGIRRVRA